MRGLFRVEIENNQLRVLLDTAKLGLTAEQLNVLGGAIRDSAARVQARAVRNVKGYPVQYDGRVFRVKTVTGALAASIDMQWPYQTVLQARVYVNGAHTAQGQMVNGVFTKPRPVAAYAAAIEFGHAEIDLKQFMQGKVVPFFASRTKNSTGPFAARGLTEVAGTGGQLWENIQLSVKLGTQGKAPMQFRRMATKAAYSGGKHGGGAYYIAFRRVGKTGWIIPAAKPRPFMRAALAQSERDVRANVRQRLAQILQPRR